MGPLSSRCGPRPPCRGAGSPGAASSGARLPVLLRRPGRLPRRVRASRVRAVVLAGVGDVRVEEVPDARVLEPTDAVVAVRAAAICGADLFPLHGLTPGFANGTILGHEFAGVVVDRGEAGTTVEVGRRVTNTSMVADGTCPARPAGRSTQGPGR